MDDLDDLFASSVNLEQDLIDRGKADGIREGELLGIKEGRAEGLERGFDFGAEIGYYAGCVLVWSHLCKKHPDSFTQRAKRSVASVQEQIAHVSKLGPEDEDIMEHVEKLQNKFKALKGMIGGQQEQHLSRGGASSDFSF